MGTIIHFCLALALVSSAVAQSAANFDTQPISPDLQSPSGEKATKAQAKEAGPVSATPSRYVGSAELEAYVDSLASVFLIRGRERDAFGQAQDPDAKPVIKASATKVARRMAVQVTPFVDIVRLLTVTTIMPGEKRFLVGTRSIKEGDQLSLNFRNKPIRVQVTEVTSRRIGFRNLDTGEMASRQLDMLPVGMTPGSQGISAPGMVPDRPNAPIDLESGDTAP